MAMPTWAAKDGRLSVSPVLADPNAVRQELNATWVVSGWSGGRIARIDRAALSPGCREEERRGGSVQATARSGNIVSPAAEWQIETGMIESTAKQLVGVRLKGPGMHWTEHGALAITALRAHDLNGHWHSFWKSLTLAP
jgi:hypothetical protein